VLTCSTMVAAAAVRIGGAARDGGVTVDDAGGGSVTLAVARVDVLPPQCHHTQHVNDV
jgi:hypothetical protein